MHPALLLLGKIPRGKVVTYKELARACNTSARAVGRILAKNPEPQKYPCYKVVASDGKLCGYSGQGGIRKKIDLLNKDGVAIVKERVDKKYFWKWANKNSFNVL